MCDGVDAGAGRGCVFLCVSVGVCVRAEDVCAAASVQAAKAALGAFQTFVCDLRQELGNKFQHEPKTALLSLHPTFLPALEACVCVCMCVCVCVCALRAPERARRHLPAMGAHPCARSHVSMCTSCTYSVHTCVRVHSYVRAHICSGSLH